LSVSKGKGRVDVEMGDVATWDSAGERKALEETKPTPAHKTNTTKRASRFIKVDGLLSEATAGTPAAYVFEQSGL
jgi:hypothetical protein